MKKFNSRFESLTHALMILITVLLMSYFMGFYYKSYYMFTVYIISFVFYSCKILLIRYNPSKVILIRNLDYFVFGIFIFQTILIRISIYIEIFYIQVDKHLFPFFYSKPVITSIWPLGIGVFVLFHLANKQVNRPILFIVSYLVIIFSYLYFFFN